MGCGSLAMLPCAHMDCLSGSEGWDCFTTMTAQTHCGCIIAKLLLHLAVRCDNIPPSVYSHIPTFHSMVTFHFEKFKHTKCKNTAGNIDLQKLEPTAYFSSRFTKQYYFFKHYCFITNYFSSVFVFAISCDNKL